MSMEANAAPVSASIPSVERPLQGRTTEGVQWRGDQGESSAGFSQRTNVSIETAIDHMADILSRISGRQQSNVEQMPQELKEVIQNIIRQSFSLETTLAQGLGSTAASQRFSLDQLTTLARILSQMGDIADTGVAPQVTEDMAALLTKLKTAVARETGGAFEPIMLTKAAFQLLDTGNPALLPKELQNILAQLNAQASGMGAQGGGGGTSLSFLNQLVQLLMPRSTESAVSMPQSSAQEQGTAASAGQSAAARPGQSEAMPGTGGNTAAAQAQESETSAPMTQRTADGTASLPRGSGAENAQMTAGRGIQANQHPEAQTFGTAGRTSAAQTASTSAQTEMVFTRDLQNTPQTMQVLRAAAQALLRGGNLSQQETILLQSFVSGRNQTLSTAQANQLQDLIHLIQQNIPGTVRQAAIEQNMPDLPRLWAFMQMVDVIATRKMTADQYRRAAKNITALALSMRGALEGENTTTQKTGQRYMSFIMPLFMGAAESYPAYIHVYDEAYQDEEDDRAKKETWLRICVLTDNIGMVELINRIYEENHVDMRLYFSDADAAWEFREHLDSIRETADGSSLIIEGIQIGAIGERRFFTN
jgi:hypothetical protein